MNINKNELESILPHKGKMFLIDEIVDYDTKKWTVTSKTLISKDFMFFDEKINAVPNYAVFELVAQSISALTGIHAKENNLPINMGMILSVANTEFENSFINEGQNVLVKAKRESEVDNVYNFSSEVFVDEKFFGNVNLTVMENR